MQIIGADIIEVNGPKDAEFGSIRFIKAIRACENYKRAYIVGMVENQGDNNYPQWWDEWWRAYQPYISATNLAHPLHLPGVPTSEREKIKYDDRLNSLLETGSIAFEQKFITGFTGTPRAHEHATFVKGVLRNQLRDYCIITTKTEKKGVTEFNRTRSGKHSGGQDDLAMAIQIALYHSHRARIEDQKVRDVQLKGYPFRWSIDEALEETTRRREAEAKIPIDVRLMMPVTEQASHAEKRTAAKRKRVAEVIRVAEESDAKRQRTDRSNPVSHSDAAAAAATSASASASAGSGLPPLVLGAEGDF